MAATAVDVGFGTTITFASGFLAKVTNVAVSGISRNAHDSSNMTSTNGWRTFVPGDLKNPGVLNVDLLFDKNYAGMKTNIASAAETVTVTTPTHAGGSSGGSYAASAFMTSFEFGAPMDGMMTAKASLQYTGEPTGTDGS